MREIGEGQEVSGRNKEDRREQRKEGIHEGRKDKRNKDGRGE